MARVFLVDDDQDLLMQNGLALKNVGHEIFKAYTAKEAMTKVKDIKPDIMIVDVMMENCDAGFQLSTYMRENHREIPVIILSGDADKVRWLGQPRDAIQGVCRFLEKPINVNELPKVVAEVLAL